MCSIYVCERKQGVLVVYYRCVSATSFAKNAEFIHIQSVYLKALCCSLGLATLVMASPVMPVDKNKVRVFNQKQY